MSASLVRKALDETSLASEEKLDHLSKVSKKRFKPPKKNKKLDKEKLLKQNLKILKTLESKIKHKKKETSGSQPESTTPEVGKESLKKTKLKKKRKKETDLSGSVFTEKDFEKFEKEYFVTC